MCEILDSENLVYTIQENKKEKLFCERFRTKNVIIELGNRSKKKAVVIGGHYDVWGTSIGINDNTVSIAVLIHLAKIIRDTGAKEKIDIVFFDKEETGFVGSKTYISNTRAHNIKYAYILDIIGFGDTPVITGATEEALASINTLADILSFKGFEGVERALPSDNLSFSLQDIPSVLIVAVPRENIINDIGRIIKSHIDNKSEVYSTFHNGPKDNSLDIINFNTAAIILNGLATVFTGVQQV